MRTTSLIFSAILLLSVTIPGSYSQSCEEEDIGKCLMPLHDVAYDLDEAVVPTMNKTTLDDHCRRYERFEDCMKDVKPYCGSLQKKSYEGIEDAYDYLCDTHRDEYFKHADCFRDKNLHTEGNYCNKTLDEKLKKLDTKNPQYKRDRICQYADDYLDCVYNAVKSFCGKDAAEWQVGLDKRSLAPLLGALGCPEWTPSANNWLVILVAALMALALVIIVISIIMLLMIRRKKAAQRRDRQQPGGIVVDPPPAYSTGPVAYGAAGGSVSLDGQAGPLPSKDGPPSGLLPPPYSPEGATGVMDNPTYATGGMDNPGYVPAEMVAPPAGRYGDAEYAESEGAFPSPTGAPPPAGTYDNNLPYTKHPPP